MSRIGSTPSDELVQPSSLSEPLIGVAIVHQYAVRQWKILSCAFLHLPSTLIRPNFLELGLPRLASSRAFFVPASLRAVDTAAPHRSPKTRRPARFSARAFCYGA